MIAENQKKKVNELIEILSELSPTQIEYLKTLINQAKNQRITLPYRFKDLHGVEYAISVSGHCFIHLPNAKRRKERKIGRFDFYNKVFMKEEKNPKNAFFLKLKGFGLPYYLIQFLHQAFRLETVRIDVYHQRSISVFEVDVNTLFDKGIFLNFNKKKGIELRIYLPLEYWKRTL